MTTRLDQPNQIWVLQSTAEDRELAATYAERTLPWTFDRMMLNTGSNGQKERALNIAKGIAGQEMLRRAFMSQGVRFDVQRKSHRDDDLFDFRVPVDGVDVPLDIKTIHYYTDYPNSGRTPLSRELIIENRSYPGPDWRRFFPMMIPHTQVNQSKEAYSFAIASSVDPRRDISTNRDGYWLSAYVHGRHLGFLSSRRLCMKREAAGKGFFIRCTYQSNGLFANTTISLAIVGEWAGEVVRRDIRMQAGMATTPIGHFSIIDSFRIEHDDYAELGQDCIEIEAIKNDYTEVERNSKGENINVLPADPFVLRKQDFVNLLLPTDYTLNVLGWIGKPEFLERCRAYHAWVWPLDKVNRFENQPWTQVTEKDVRSLTSAGFDDCIMRNPSGIAAGWLKTTGMGNGACCYVFPNIFGRGGVNETNLYVLPQDLHTMESLLQERV